MIGAWNIGFRVINVLNLKKIVFSLLSHDTMAL